MIHQLRQRKEEAQAMVLMAAAMLGMLAFVGLAVDGGNVYYQRRNAQNAADAASFAGTIKLAENFAKPEDEQTLTEAQLCAFMQNYGTVKNPSDPTQFVPMYAYQSRPINCSSNAVVQEWESSLGTRALTGVASDSYISQLLGRKEFKVRGVATVQYGPPSSISGGTGVVPFVLKDDWLEGRIDGEGKTLNPAQPRYDINNPNDPNDPNSVPASQKFMIWGSAKGTPGNQDVSEGSRGWVNASCKDNRNLPDEKCNSSNSDVKDWMYNGYKGEVAIGDQLKADNGVRASSLQEAQARIDDNRPIVIVPIYHDTHGSIYYHVVGFATMRLTKVVSQGSNKAIEGYFINYLPVSGGMAPSGTTNYGTVVIQPTG